MGRADAFRATVCKSSIRRRFTSLLSPT